MSDATYPIREGWLTAATGLLLPYITRAAEDVGQEMSSPPIRVSVGWPKGTRGKGATAIGQCWNHSCSADGTAELFISPELFEAQRVLDVLAHEVIHALVGTEHGHRKPFGRVARAIGLEGKLTATVAGPAFIDLAQSLLPQLGGYPHAQLKPGSAGGPGGPPKQGTRMLKVQCPGCGMIVRTTAKWIEAVGPPTCACGSGFEVAV